MNSHTLIHAIELAPQKWRARRHASANGIRGRRRAARDEPIKVHIETIMLMATYQPPGALLFVKWTILLPLSSLYSLVLDSAPGAELRWNKIGRYTSSPKTLIECMGYSSPRIDCHLLTSSSSTRAPGQPVPRPRTLSPTMRDAICRVQGTAGRGGGENCPGPHFV